jgi:hypothetical protein
MFRPRKVLEYFKRHVQIALLEIYYTVCPQFSAQYVHNLLHSMFTIY